MSPPIFQLAALDLNPADLQGGGTGRKCSFSCICVCIYKSIVLPSPCFPSARKIVIFYLLMIMPIDLVDDNHVD